MPGCASFFTTAALESPPDEGLGGESRFVILAPPKAPPSSVAVVKIFILLLYISELV